MSTCTILVPMFEATKKEIKNEIIQSNSKIYHNVCMLNIENSAKGQEKTDYRLW